MTVEEKVEQTIFEHQQIMLDLITHASLLTRYISSAAAQNRSLVAWRTLSNLDYHGELRVSDLAEMEKISQPSMTGILKRLEESGAIARSVDDTDKRAQHIKITDQGAQELSDFRYRMTAQLEPELQKMDGFDIAVLAKATELIKQLNTSIT